MILVKMNGMQFSAKDPNLFSGFNWDNFESSESVYVEEAGLGDEENCLSFEGRRRDRIILEYHPTLAADVNSFVEYFTCVGVQ